MKLPLPSSPLRELFNVEDLIAWRSFPMKRNLIFSLRRTVAQKGINSAQGICLDCDGRVLLLKCGPKGGIKTLWDFGNPLN